MFLHRLITGLILIAVVLLGVFCLPFSLFMIAVTAISLFAAWEWGCFICSSPFSWYRYLYVLLVSCFMYLVRFIPIHGLLWLSFLWWLFAFGLIILYAMGIQKYLFQSWIRMVFGIMVIVPFWAAVNTIRLAQNGSKTLFLLLCFVWAADTGAYFAGKWWGKHTLIPRVSPKKTWEGLYGGFLLTLLVSVAANIILQVEFPRWIYLIGLAVVVMFFSVVGDLFESVLKRYVGVKDSGSILPGHGGILDRLDSLTAAAPIFLFGCLLIGFHA